MITLFNTMEEQRVESKDKHNEEQSSLIEQSHAVEYSKEIEQSSEKECSSGKEGSRGKECFTSLKMYGGKKSCVQFKATRHVKKQKSVIDFFIKIDIINFWAKSQLYVFR